MRGCLGGYNLWGIGDFNDRFRCFSLGAACNRYFAYFFGRSDTLLVETASARSLATAPAQASVLDATGYITARRLATVSAKITGRVQTVLIEEGMRVEQGQVMATLEDVDVKAQRALGAARLESARSQLAEIRTNLANAEREANRQQGLAERKLARA